ncbi:uncharacterized protein [Panulirus ornatus]|uniref:uncharacterized protein n=1 Tax=Panulirus ornatus TaxID=150431 RepID=UPI003A87688D
MPLPLSFCRLANITASSLSLTCQRPAVATDVATLYRAEVYFENLTMFANVTSRRPNFNVSRLDPGTSYQIKVYVSHGPITSQPVLVSAYTSRTSVPSTDQTGEHPDGEVVVENPGVGGPPADGGGLVAGDGGTVGDAVGEATGGVGGGGGGGVGVAGSGGGMMSPGSAAGGMGALVGVAAVTLVVVLGVAWAWRHCRASCGAAGGSKGGHVRPTDDCNNPDVVPSIGPSFSKRTASPQRFWHKEKTFHQPAGAVGGAAEVVDAGDGSSPTSGPTSVGAEAATTCVGGASSAPSPSGHRKTSTGCLATSSSSPSPSASPKTPPGCAASSASPRESHRTTGSMGDSSSVVEGRKTSCAGGKTPAEARGGGGGGDPSPAGVEGSPGVGGAPRGRGGDVASQRPVSGVVFRTPAAGGAANSHRPLSAVGDIVVNPLRQSLILSEEDFPPEWRGEEPRLPRDRLSYPIMASKHSPRDEKYPGVRFSLPPRDEPAYPGTLPARGPPENGYYSGVRLKYKARDLEDYPGVRGQHSPRDEEEYPGSRPQPDPGEDQNYARIRPQHSPRDENNYPRGHPQHSPRDENNYPRGHPQHSPRDENNYPRGHPQHSPRDENNYPRGHPQHSPRDENNYHRGHPQHSPRDEINYHRGHLQHSPRDECNYPRAHHQHSPRDEIDYPRVRPQHSPRGEHDYPRVRPQHSPTGEHDYPRVRPQHSPRGEHDYPRVRAQPSPTGEEGYASIRPHHSPRDEENYPGGRSPDEGERYPHHSPRGDQTYPGGRSSTYRAPREVHSYIGVRVHHPTRGAPPPGGRPQPTGREVGTYPGVRGGRGRRHDQKVVSRSDLHCPVDQLIKATETVV